MSKAMKLEMEDMFMETYMKRHNELKDKNHPNLVRLFKHYDDIVLNGILNGYINYEINYVKALCMSLERERVLKNEQPSTYSSFEHYEMIRKSPFFSKMYEGGFNEERKSTTFS